MSTHCQVLLIAGAEEDVRQIYGYLLRNGSRSAADRVYAGIVDACETLSELPERGHAPRELEALGVADFREVHAGPYRIIYHIGDRCVHVHCVIDGRRDLSDILRQRLLR